MSIFGKKRLPRAFVVLACACLVAFFVSARIAGFAIDKASPFVLFGNRAQKEKISVVAEGRGLIKFSNGVEIRGIKLLPFDIFFGCATCLIGVPLWWALFRGSIVGVRIFSPAFANEILDAYRQIMATFRSPSK